MIAYVLATLALSTVPNDTPVRSIIHAGVNYDVYLHEGHDYKVSVCARYTPTGSRIERNTCGTSYAFGLHSVAAQSGSTPWVYDLHATYRYRARLLERRANELVNTQISPEQFWYSVSHQLIEPTS